MFPARLWVHCFVVLQKTCTLWSRYTQQCDHIYEIRSPIRRSPSCDSGTISWAVSPSWINNQNALTGFAVVQQEGVSVHRIHRAAQSACKQNIPLNVILDAPLAMCGLDTLVGAQWSVTTFWSAPRAWSHHVIQIQPPNGGHGCPYTSQRTRGRETFAHPWKTHGVLYSLSLKGYSHHCSPFVEKGTIGYWPQREL